LLLYRERAILKIRPFRRKCSDAIFPAWDRCQQEASSDTTSLTVKSRNSPLRWVRGVVPWRVAVLHHQARKAWRHDRTPPRPRARCSMGYPLDYQGTGRPFQPLAEPGSGRGKDRQCPPCSPRRTGPGPPGETLPPVRQSPVEKKIVFAETEQRPTWSTPGRGTFTGAGTKAYATPPSYSAKYASWVIPAASWPSSDTCAGSARPRPRAAAGSQPPRSFAARTR
jgi:hypothetical protein